MLIGVSEPFENGLSEVATTATFLAFGFLISRLLFFCPLATLASCWFGAGMAS